MPWDLTLLHSCILFVQWISPYIIIWKQVPCLDMFDSYFTLQIAGSLRSVGKRRFLLLSELLAQLNVTSSASLFHIGVLKLVPELAERVIWNDIFSPVEQLILCLFKSFHRPKCQPGLNSISFGPCKIFKLWIIYRYLYHIHCIRY